MVVAAAAAYGCSGRCLRKIGVLRDEQRRDRSKLQVRILCVAYRLVVGSGRLELATTSCHVTGVKFLDTPGLITGLWLQPGMIFFLLWAYLIVYVKAQKENIVREVNYFVGVTKK